MSVCSCRNGKPNYKFQVFFLLYPKLKKFFLSKIPKSDIFLSQNSSNKNVSIKCIKSDVFCIYISREKGILHNNFNINHFLEELLVINTLCYFAFC